MSAEARRFAGATTLALALCLSTVEARTDVEIVRRTFDVDPAGVVSIDAGSARVRIEGWDAPRLVVEAPADPAAGLDIERRGLRTSIDVSPVPDRPGDLRLQLPASSRIEVATTSGSLEIEGLTGDVVVHTLSGATRVVGRPGRVTIDTVGGPVTLRDGAERAVIETVGGAVDLGGRLGHVQIESVNASVDLLPTAWIERLGVETVNGSVTVAGALAAGARVGLESHAGAIHLDLPSNTSARIEATTFAGRFLGDWSGARDAESDPGDGRRRVVLLGGGSAEVEVETFAGAIRLQRDR